jgi:hypothetical protein
MPRVLQGDANRPERAGGAPGVREYSLPRLCSEQNTGFITAAAAAVESGVIHLPGPADEAARAGGKLMLQRGGAGPAGQDPHVQRRQLY